MTASRRTRIQHRDFICKGEAHHAFRAAVRLQVADDGTTVESGAQFKPFSSGIAVKETFPAGATLVTGALLPGWTGLPICPTCDSIAEERETYDSSLATVPSTERFTAWLSPDGQRVAVPGRRDALMPSRYVAAGYRPIEAHSMRDLDRIEQVRAAQTGNEVFSEMNFSESTRVWHDERDYDPDSMTEL